MVSTAFTLACLRNRVLRPSYVVYSATTDPTRDRTERFTCLRFVHPGMLHEKSHLKCPIGQTLAKSNEKWTSERWPSHFEPPRHVRRLHFLGGLESCQVSSSRRYPPELRERAVRMVAEISDQHDSEWAAMQAVSAARGWARRDGAQVGAPGRGRRRSARRGCRPRSPRAARAAARESPNSKRPTLSWAGLTV